MQKNINFETESQSIRPSFDEMYEAAKEQIDIDCFPAEQVLLAASCAGMMATVYLLRDGDNLRIGQTLLPAKDVKAVYKMLRNEHIAYVLDAWCRITSRVHNPTGYLRTAMFNAVFELDVGEQNLYAAGGDGG